MVADTPDQPIGLKAFSAKIITDFPAREKERAGYKPLPKIKNVTSQMLLDNFLQVQKDVAMIIRSELDRMSNSPELEELIIE